MSDRSLSAAWPRPAHIPLPTSPPFAPLAADPGNGAFEAAVQPHLDAMSAAARAVVRSPDLADDAVQDVLARLWQRGRISEDPRGALCHLARLAGRQHLRAARRRCFHEACASSEECHEDDPSVALERDERRATVRRVLAELKPDHRELLERVLDEEVDYQALAHERGIPIGTVRSRLHRARQELRRRLESPEFQSSLA